jgi:hypothetical protein
MTRLLLGSALAGVLLAVLVAWSFRAEVAAAAEPPPARPPESTAELLEAAVRGCVGAGGAASTGILDGVVVARCTPGALPHLGTFPAVSRGRP